MRPLRRQDAWVGGLLCLAIAAGALYTWYSSSKIPGDGDLRSLDGVVERVDYNFSRAGARPAIHFTLRGSAEELVYQTTYPSYADADACIKPGAPVYIRVLPAKRPEIWEMRCRDTTLADLATMHAAQLEYGRTAAWISGIFFVATVIWGWLLVTVAK